MAATGAFAATEYGAASNGVSDAEWDKLQRIAASGMSPSAGGRSRTALFALKGDPTWRAATAPIHQWIKAVWPDRHQIQEFDLLTMQDLKAA